MNIPEIVKEYCLKHNGRMPETEQEVNQYLDLINHAKEYSKSFQMKQLIGEPMMKKLGFKTPTEVKKSFHI